MDLVSINEGHDCIEMLMESLTFKGRMVSFHMAEHFALNLNWVLQAQYKQIHILVCAPLRTVGQETPLI